MPRHSAPRKQRVILNSFVVILNLFQDLKSAPSRFRILNAALSVRNDRHIKTKSVFAKSVELKLPKLKDFKKPTPAWTSALVGVLILALAVNLVAFTPTQFAEGAYTTSTTDADGNTHLGNNTVNDTYFYDTTQDSNQQTQQQLGVDPNWRQGVSRKSYALKFDGTDDRVLTSSNNGLNFTTEDFSLSLWIKIPSTTTAGYIVTRADANSVGYTLYLGGGASSGKLRFFLAESATKYVEIISPAVVNDDAWHHVLVTATQVNGQYTVSSASMAMFIDGTRQTISTSSTGGGGSPATITCSSCTLAVGSNYAGSSNYLAATVDEMHISTGLRQTANFVSTRREQEDSSTRLLYHFDEGVGAASTTVYDSSIYGNNGTMGASTAFPTPVSGANAIMDGYDGSKGYQNQSGAGNISLSERSTRSDDAAYEVRGTGSNGLTFDSSNDYVDATQSISFASGESFTYEAYIFPTSSTGERFIIDRATGSPIDLRTGSTSLCFRVNGVNDTCSTLPALNRWYHVAGVRDTSSTQTRLYVDGALTASSSVDAGALTHTPRIGDHLNGGTSWGGKIDEVRISRSARYTSNFTPQRRFATDANTAALWHFDEGTGTSAADSSGNASTGTLLNGSSNSPAADGTANGPIWSEGIASTSTATTSQNWAMPNYAHRKRVNVATTTAIGAGHAVETTENRGTIMDNKQTRPDGKDWRMVHQPGDATRSLSFDGSSDVVTVPDSTSLSITSAMTAEAWVKPASLGNYHILDKSQCCANITGYRLNMESSGLVSFLVGNDTTYAYRRTSRALVPGEWHHVAAVATGSTLNIYINGILDNGATGGTGSLSVLPTDGPNVFHIGARGDNNVRWNGQIDEVRVSNTIRYTTNFSPSRTPFTPDTNTKGLWHLDEGSGQIVVDSSTNENHGTLGATSGSSTDDPTWLTGTTADGAVSTVQEVPRFIPHGNAVSFDNTDDYITIPDNASLDGMSQLTIEAWIKKPTESGFNPILSKWLSGQDYSYWFGLSGDKLHAQVSTAVGTNDVTASAAIPLNEWVHVAMTYEGNGSAIKLYVNGSRAAATGGGSGQSTTIRNTTHAVEIGRYESNRLFSGQIDEVRLSNSARYRNNFTPSTEPFANDQYTAGLWHLDEGTGTTVADSSGNSNTGTFGASTAAPTWITNGGKVKSTNQTQFKTVAPVGSSTTSKDYYLYYGSPNEQGSAQSYNSYGLKFDGSNDYASVANASAPSISSALTVSAWFNTAGTGTNNGIIVIKQGTTGSSTSDWGLIHWRNAPHTGKVSLALKTANNAWNDYFASVTITDNAWHHVVATYVSGTVKIYIDGVDRSPAAGTPTGNIASSGGPLRIGQEDAWAPGEYYKGTIGDLRIYSRTLSATEAAALYTNTPTVSNANLAAHWKFDDTTPATTTADDAIGSADATLTGFNFDANSNWVVNTNHLGVATEPTQTMLVTEQESPIFFEWQTAGSAWPSDRTQTFQLGTGEQQLGSTGVYVQVNPSGVYSRHDYYRINSWAIEHSPAAGNRGVKNAFPEKANLIATAGGLDIIDASTNKLWMRFSLGTNTILGATNAPVQVTAKNGRIYLTSANGLIEIQLDLDDAHRWTAGGNSSYSDPIAERNASAANVYATATGHALNSTTVNDVSVAVSSNKQYVAAALSPTATNAGITVIAHATQYDANNASPSGSAVSDYGNGATTDSYTDVVLTSGMELYGANSTDSQLDRFDDVSTTGDDIAPTRSYTTSSTPALRSGTLNDISVTESTSTADNGTSNTVALAHSLGTDVIQEHGTFASSAVRYFSRTGTVGSSNWSSKQFGGAMDLDGSDDYAVVADSNSLDITSTFTIEAWIKLDTLPASGAERIVAKEVAGGGTTTGSYGFGVLSTGKLRFTIFGSVDIDDNGSGTISTGTWHHVAVSKTGTSYHFFVDGTLNSTQTSAMSPTANISTLLIGRRGSGEFIDGQIGELRISNSARYTSSMTPSSSPLTTDANTMALWHFDEASGQTAYDASSNANNATRGASSTVGTDDPLFISPAIAGASDKATAVGIHNPGSNGDALSFDGTDDIVQIPSGGGLNAQSETTLTLWVRWNGTQDTNAFGHAGTTTVRQSDGSFSDHMLYLSGTDPTTATLKAQSVNQTTLTGSTAVGNAQWRHLALVQSASAGKSYLYMDGKLEASGTFSGTTSNNISVPLSIGGLNSSNGDVDSFSTSHIDDVRTYTRALSADEVRQLSRNDATISTSGLVGWWRFNETTGQIVTDNSSSGNNGTLGASSASGSDDPTWTTGSPVRNPGFLWVGTNGTSADDGAMTAISMETDKQITAYTATTSGLPDLDITALSLGRGGLALVGTEVGAWNPGTAGIVVDDTAASPATAVNNVRINSGTTRIKGGTTRIKPL